MKQDLIVIEVKEPRVECAVSKPAHHISPFGATVVVSGALEICWRTTEYTVEMTTLSGYIDSWATIAISDEDLVAQVYTDLADVGVEPVEVVWHGTTSGMPLAVRKAQELVLAEPVHRPRPGDAQ